MTRIKTKKTTRIFAIMMAAVLLAICVPISVFGTSEDFPLTDIAEITESTAGDAAGVPVSDNSSAVTGAVIGEYVEVVSRREENVKHFALPDGTYAAIVYPTAVHRKDADGVWQDINNDLALTSVKGTQKYATADSRVSFSQSYAQSTELMTLSENGYTISMSLLRGNDDTALLSTESVSLAAPIITNSVKKELPKTDVKLEDVARIHNKSSIIYSNVKANTDIEYILDGNSVKENIIVKTAASRYEYTFELRLTGLVAELQENGSIAISDATTNTQKYEIPAPYMYDASGELSYAVEYTLIEVSSGRYLLAVTADETWINATGRAFPVTIDPAIQELKPIVLASDTYVSESSPNMNYCGAQNLPVGYDTTALIAPYLPTLYDNTSFLQAELFFNYYFDTDFPDVTSIGVYPITSSWTETEVTYNSCPSIANEPIDNLDLAVDQGYTSTNLGFTCFDISEIVVDWYNGNAANNGVAIKFEYGTFDVNIKSYDSGTNTCEFIVIKYTPEFEEGVYAIENTDFDYQYMKMSNAYLEHTYHLYPPNLLFASDISEPIRSSLFKIGKKDEIGHYVIRSMVNNRKVLGVEDGILVFKDYPCADEDVPYEDTFYIFDKEIGRVIRHSRSNTYITMQDDDMATLSLSYEADASSGMYWDCKKYNGSGRFDFDIDIVEFPLEATCIITPSYWSTMIGCNVPELEISSSYSDDEIDSFWDDDTGTMEITFYILGTFDLEWTISGGGYYPSDNISIKSVRRIPDDEIVQKTLDIEIYYGSSVLNNNTIYEYTHEEIEALFDSVNWYFWKEFNFRFNLVECELATELDLPYYCVPIVNDEEGNMCDCADVDAYCATNHHTSADRLINILTSTDDYYVLRLVGYRLCDEGHHSSAGIIHGMVPMAGNKNSICSVSSSKNCLELVIIHELTHSLGVSHDDICLGNCVMIPTISSNRPQDYTDLWGEWCTNCKATVMNTVYN